MNNHFSKNKIQNQEKIPQSVIVMEKTDKLTARQLENEDSDFKNFDRKVSSSNKNHQQEGLYL